jgi:pimeloyl-ACP methyl ester carboxylesterase
VLTPCIFADALTRRTLERDGLEPLVYFTGGNGSETLAIINAYGQSLAFWRRLVTRLTDRYRIVIWQARGTCSQSGGVASAYPVDEHVRDMRFLFNAEGIECAHLLGWCTGPKTALAFNATYPGTVSSLMLLTGCFVHKEAFMPLHTRYESTMTGLCRMVDQRPHIAPQLSEMFKTVLFGPGKKKDCPAPQIRDDIAALVQAPFQTPESIVHYARQLLTFWDYDISSLLPQVAVPALFIGGEDDDITDPKLSRQLARQAPRAVFAEVLGGSHYIHYDQHALLGDLITDFTRRGYGFTSRHERVQIERF